MHFKNMDPKKAIHVLSKRYKYDEKAINRTKKKLTEDCSVCLEMSHTMCLLVTCQHMFCSKCIPKLKKCPLCRQKINNERLIILTDKLNIELTDNESDGTDEETDELKDMKAHKLQRWARQYLMIKKENLSLKLADSNIGQIKFDIVSEGKKTQYHMLERNIVNYWKHFYLPDIILPEGKIHISLAIWMKYEYFVTLEICKYIPGTNKTQGEWHDIMKYSFIPFPQKGTIQTRKVSKWKTSKSELQKYIKYLQEFNVSLKIKDDYMISFRSDGNQCVFKI